MGDEILEALKRVNVISFNGGQTASYYRFLAILDRYLSEYPNNDVSLDKIKQEILEIIKEKEKS